MIDISREISLIKQVPSVGQYLAKALQLLQDGANGLGSHLGADPTQMSPAPSTIQGLSVKADGNGNVHAVINDNNPIQKGVHYFVEYQQIQVGDPLVFSQPHVVHLGTSRTMHPIALPAQDDNGNAVQYIFRGFSQYPGGLPGTPVKYGGSDPTPVLPGGTTRMTLLPSTGSGTAQSSGQQPGQGFGTNLYRQAAGPKRKAAL